MFVRKMLKQVVGCLLALTTAATGFTLENDAVKSNRNKVYADETLTDNDAELTAEASTVKETSHMVLDNTKYVVAGGCTPVSVFNKSISFGTLQLENPDVEVSNILFDDATNIKVVLPYDISTDVFLKVEQLSESTEGRNIILEDNMADSRIYDISIIDANGDVVLLDEEVTIMIPSPDWNIDNIWYREYFGKTDENEWDGYKSIETENENGYEIFNTNEWGIYAFRLFTEENPNFTYMYKVLDGGSVEIVHYNNLGDSTELIIPKKIKDKEVTSIGEKAFYGCIRSKIVIPDSVTSIGEYAFSDCNSLTNIEISGSVTSIGKKAFANCYNLTDIEIPDSVTDIGEGAFRYCESLENLILPEKLTSIDNATFSYCQRLKNINIPKNVTSIGDGAFWVCGNLQNVEIPDSVVNIGEDAFSYCRNLTGINIPANVNSIGDGFLECYGLEKFDVDERNTQYISQDGVLFDKEMKTLIKYPSGKKDDEYIIPECVTSINRLAISDCSSLISVKITDSVTNIGYGSFWGCSNLTCIVIQNSVMSIDDRAFFGCDNLTIYGEEGSYAEQYAKGNDIPFIALISLTDDITNIEIKDTEGAISQNATLKTKQLSEIDELYKNIILTDKIADSTVKPEDVIFTAYDISLVDENNTPVQPNGTVTVKIPCPEDNNVENCKVYRVGEAGEFTDMNAKYQDGYMVFETDHLSTYIITETELITGVQVIKGDANGDGKMDIKDSALIKRYLAGWDVEINMAAADMDGDGKVTIKDSALIKRQLVGWE